MTLKNWLVNKLLHYGREPLASMRFQSYYFKLLMPVPTDFNAFSKYFRQTLRGKSFKVRLYFTMNLTDCMTVTEVTFGDVKRYNDNTMQITVWISKETTQRGAYSGWTGAPPRASYNPPLQYNGLVAYHA